MARAAAGTGRGVWRGRGLVWRTGLAVAAVLVVAAVVVAAALATSVAPERHHSAPEPVPPEPAPVLRAADGAAPVPEPTALARTLDPLAAAPQLGRLAGQVVDDETGQVLWERDPHQPTVPASSAKLLTAVAALQALPPDATVDTVLAQGTDADTLVVVPGGDVTMSASGQSPLFPGAPDLGRLVDIARSAGVHPARIVVDPGPFGGPPMAPGWSEDDVAGGNITGMQPWMLDSGRIDPADEYSPRQPDAELSAARALGRELGVDPGRVELSRAPVQRGRELGRVASAPLADRVRSMLVHSDNVLAESVCRQVAMARGADGGVDFAAGTSAVLATLEEKGLDTAGVQLDDCSGMSPGDRVPPAVLTGMLRAASAPEASRPLRSLLDALPVGGVSGTLADRYTGPSAGGAGWVRAKTGTLTGTSALAGTVTDVDGRAMSFALMSTGTSPADARPALDRVAAALRDCGCR